MSASAAIASGVPVVPACPPLFTAALQEAQAEESDFNAVRRLIDGDDALRPAFMAAVNSTRFALPRQVTSLQAAMLLLGVRSTAMLVTSLVARDAFPRHTDWFSAHYWRNTARHAALAAMVAQQLNALPRDLAHAYGLVRDSGVLMLALADRDYEQLVRRAPGTMSATLMTIERRRFATDHREIGGRLAEAWGLPGAVRWAVRHHHAFALPMAADETEALGHRLIAVGLVADWLGWGLDQRPDPEWRNAEVFAAATLGVSVERFDALKALAPRVAYAG